MSERAVLALVIVLLSALAFPFRGYAERGPELTVHSVRLERRNGVTDGHFEFVQSTINSLPKHYWEVMHHVRLRIVVIRSLGEARLTFKPRSAAQWSGVRGTCYHNGGELVILVAERYIRENVERPVEDVQGVVLHELGHAFEFAYGLSSGRKFRAAYEQDVKAMPAERPSNFWYFLLSGSDGPKEAFAEAFGIHLRSTLTRPQAAPDWLITHERAFARLFPSVMNQVEESLHIRIGLTSFVNSRETPVPTEVVKLTTPPDRNSSVARLAIIAERVKAAADDAEEAATRTEEVASRVGQAVLHLNAETRRTTGADQNR